MTRTLLSAAGIGALRFAAVAIAAALVVATQASFVSPVKPPWAQAMPYGMPLAAALWLGPRGVVPLFAGTVAACLALGLPPFGVMAAAGLAEFLVACWLRRYLELAPGGLSTVGVVRLSLAAGLTALTRGAVATALAPWQPGGGPDDMTEVFFPTTISTWLGGVTLAPLALVWVAPSAWVGWTPRRAVVLAALLAAATTCVALLDRPGARDDVAISVPVTCLLFALLLALGGRYELGGVVLFQVCATAVFTAYCQRELRESGIVSPAALLTTGFFGFVNVVAMLLAASWSERRLAAEAREALLAEVVAQRDELARLAAERGVQQAFLAATFDQLPAAVVTLGPDETVLSMNAAARDWLGGLSVAVGRPLREHVNWATYRPDGTQLPTAECPVVRTVATGEALRNVELRYVVQGRPGEGRELTLNSAPVLGPAGENLGAIALYQDLTAFKRSERRLRDSEERLRMVMRWTRLQVWDGDLTTGEVSANESIEEWFGLPPAARPTRFDRLIAHFHPGDQERVRGRMADALRDGLDDVEVSYRIPRPDGSTSYYLTRGRVQRDADGRPTPRYTGVTIDITREKEGEQRLRLLESVVVHARDGVVVLEAEVTAHAGRAVLYVNEAFAGMSGYAVEELVGRSLHLLRGPDTDPDTLDRLRRSLNDGRPLQTELLNYRKDGTPFWVELSLVPVPEAEGESRCAYWVMIQRDISDRKRAEQALREREEQLRQAQKMETVGQLAGGVAHDFNNLLTAVICNLCLVDLPAGDPNKALLATAEKAAHRAAELTSKLLGFARRNQLLVAPVDVAGFVGEVVDLLRRTIDPRITFRVDVPPLEWLVLADANLLSQVLLNLCLNSRDAMPAGGELTISAQAWPPTAEQVTRHLPAADAYLRVSVGDTGTGMAPGVRARLFEPFFTTKPIGQGTGLGLAMVDGIVRQHEGWVECETEEGVGTTFHLYLPAVGAAADHADAPGKLLRRSNGDFVLELPPLDDPPAAAEPSANGVAGHAPLHRAGGHILLVDDEEMIRDISRAVLEGAGYTVREATDGVEAVELFREHHAEIDLVILDLIMPRLSGRDASQHMAAVDPAVKILLSSGYSTDDVSDIPAALGLLSKPFRPSELLNAVRGALEPPPTVA